MAIDRTQPAAEPPAAPAEPPPPNGSTRFEVSFSSREQLAREYTENISSGGMFVRTDTPPPLFAEVGVRLALGGEAPLEVLGKVVHVQAPATGSGGFGVQFDATCRAELQRWCTSAARISRTPGPALRQVMLLGFAAQEVGELQRLAGLMFREPVQLVPQVGWTDAMTLGAASDFAMLVLDARHDTKGAERLCDAAKLRAFSRSSPARLAVVGLEPGQEGQLPKDVTLACAGSLLSAQLIERLGEWLSIPLRSNLRLSLSGIAVVTTAEHALAGELSDVSIGGACLVTTRHPAISPGRAISLEFFLPNNSSPLSARAQVRWVRPDGSHRLVFGVAFEKLPTESVQAIEVFVGNGLRHLNKSETIDS